MKSKFYSTLSLRFFFFSDYIFCKRIGNPGDLTL